MPHFFIGVNDHINNGEITIGNTDTYRHIARSLRAKAGEKLLLIDDNQIQYETVIKEISSIYLSTSFLLFSIIISFKKRFGL